MTDRLSAIQQWLQREGEALLYTPDAVPYQVLASLEELAFVVAEEAFMRIFVQGSGEEEPTGLLRNAPADDQGDW